MTSTPQIAQIAPIVPDRCTVVRAFCTLGATDEHLAGLFAVSPETIARWMNDLPDFAQAVRRGRKMTDPDVLDSLHRRATGYAYSAEKTVRGPAGPMVVSYTKHRPPNVRAGIEWLTSRCPEEWGRGAIKRKLQDIDDARDRAARRLPCPSPQALAALVAEVSPDRGRERLPPPPPSEPDVRISRIRLSS